MNPVTEKNINEAINWLQQTGGSIQDFAAEQAPLYCSEILKWEIIRSSVAAAACLAFVAVGILIMTRLRKGWATDSRIDGHFFFGIVSFGVIVICLVAGVISSSCLIKAKVAPRLVIVEHLRSLKP